VIGSSATIIGYGVIDSFGGVPAVGEALLTCRVRLRRNDSSSPSAHVREISIEASVIGRGHPSRRGSIARWRSWARTRPSPLGLDKADYAGWARSQIRAERALRSLQSITSPTSSISSSDDASSSRS
jgi:hypothetical protein